MSHRNLRTSRRLSLESLEGRSLLAGVVSVSVSGGDLIITGDGEANEIQIIQSLQNGAPIAGRYFIAGQNNTTITGTVNGFANGVVTDDIVINLNGNNDRLTMGDGINGHFIVPDDLEINTADGSDVVVVNRVTVRDDATILTGNGNDSLTVRVTVGGLAGIDGGDNNMTIDTGGLADTLVLQNIFVRRDLNINTGDDFFADTIDFRVGNIGRDTTIVTGGGADNVLIADVGFNGNLAINTGSGTDTVRIDRCQVNQLSVLLGSGTDQLTINNTSAARASLNGGTEADTLFLSGNSFALFPAPQSF